MPIRRTMLTAAAAILLASISMGAGCDQSTPKAKIKPEAVKVKVGEAAHLTLVVPDRYTGLHRELWTVEPATLGELYYNQAEPRHREATFKSKTAGTGKIKVVGFYGDQTAPYSLDEIAVTVE